MAYQLKVDGMAELSETLSKMEEKAPKAAARALYEGAGIMADEIRKGATTIKTGKGSSRSEARYATPAEKEIVLTAAAGIAKFGKNGTEIDTSVGFKNSGYAELDGKMVPIPKIVNSINSGTSFMHKQPFVRKAASKAAPKAMEAMRKQIEAEFEAIGRGYQESMK